MSNTQTAKMQTVLTTNNAYDTLLLVTENGTVVSRWPVTRETLVNYIADGARTNNWHIGEWPAGFSPDEAETEEVESELRTIAAYGEEYGRNGKIDNAERQEFWNVA